MAEDDFAYTWSLGDHVWPCERSDRFRYFADRPSTETHRLDQQYVFSPSKAEIFFE